MGRSQRPIAAAAFEEKAGPASWKRLPSHFLVATGDQAIHPDGQRSMAARAGATTIEVDGSHAVVGLPAQGRRRIHRLRSLIPP